MNDLQSMERDIPSSSVKEREGGRDKKVVDRRRETGAESTSSHILGKMCNVFNLLNHYV